MLMLSITLVFKYVVIVNLSYDGVKSILYVRALNGLLRKTKGKFDNIVMLHLMDAYCKPLLVWCRGLLWC